MKKGRVIWLLREFQGTFAGMIGHVHATFKRDHPIDGARHSERPVRPLSSMGMTSVRHPLLCERSRASGRVANVRDPAALAACEPNRFGLAVEADRRRLEPRASCIVERVDVHDRVRVFVDLARHDRHHAAPRAHEKLRGARAVLVARHPLGIHDRDRQRARRVRGPHAAVLRAERAATRARDDRRRFRLPRQVERDVSAVTRAVDHHAAEHRTGPRAMVYSSASRSAAQTHVQCNHFEKGQLVCVLDVLKSVVTQYPQELA